MVMIGSDEVLIEPMSRKAAYVTVHTSKALTDKEDGPHKDLTIGFIERSFQFAGFKCGFTASGEYNEVRVADENGEEWELVS